MQSTLHADFLAAAKTSYAAREPPKNLIGEVAPSLQSLQAKKDATDNTEDSKKKKDEKKDDEPNLSVENIVLTRETEKKVKEFLGECVDSIRNNNFQSQILEMVKVGVIPSVQGQILEMVKVGVTPSVQGRILEMVKVRSSL